MLLAGRDVAGRSTIDVTNPFDGSIVGSVSEASAEHVQEALQGVVLVERLVEDEDVTWLDVGSGGGLPGLVVAAVRPWDVVLIEPRERRAAFLELGMASVGMGSGRVIRGRWSRSTWNENVFERVRTRSKTSFSILSSRAVFEPELWLAEASRGVVSRGIVLCHVEIGGERVGGRKPRAVMSGKRWSVAAFDVE